MDTKNEKISGSSVSDRDLRTILEHLPRLVMLIDLDGTILYWNKGGEKVFGYRAEEVEGKQVGFLYPERTEEMFQRELDDLKNGKSISFEAKGLCKDGTNIWLDVKRVMIENSRGEPIILGTASDISLQKHAEHRLEESRARTEAILETAVEAIITIDKKGLIQSFNKAAEEMFGYKSEEVTGRNVSILMPSPYMDEHDQYIENYLKTGERKIIGIGREVRGKRKDGAIFPIELAVSETKFGDEIIFTGLIKDISDRRKLENEILEISEDERRRIGQDLHDGLGQMLSGIGLISRNLARKLKANELPGADEVMEISKMIKEADEHARSLAHGLAHIELENEGLRVALHRLCERFEQMSNIRCTIECPEDGEIERRTTALHLYRITQEAINNAVKHGEASEVAVRLNVNKKYLQLFIEDNGVGIKDADKLNKSKGMGLKTMRYRAHILGGNLKIGESPEGWTRVVCTVPTPDIHNKP